MVERHGGVFLENQEFEIPWRSTQFKKQHRLTFRIRCHYDKEETGYRLTYRILPAGLTWLRILLSVLFWVLAAIKIWNPVEPEGTIAATAVGMVAVIADIWQMRNCEQEFLRRFTTVTG